jgi:hypothetical protein
MFFGFKKNSKKIYKWLFLKMLLFYHCERGEAIQYIDIKYFISNYFFRNDVCRGFLGVPKLKLV